MGLDSYSNPFGDRHLGVFHKAAAKTSTFREENDMKSIKAISGIAALALAITLAACGGKGTLEQVTLDEADGIKVTAENASTDQEATTTGAITVEEGDGIIISPFTEKGSFHLTITSSDGEAIYDDDVDGKVYFMIDAEPGTYDVTTSGNRVTGWMTVFSQNKDDEAAINASLDETLEENDIDPESVTDGE